MFYIPQISSSDCGFACLKMVLAELHNDKNYLFLPQDESHGLYSLQELKNIAESFNLDLDAVTAINKHDIVNNTNLPMVAIMDLPTGGKHAVVVNKVRPKTIYYVDPALGKMKMKLDSFVEKWDGSALMINQVRVTPCSYKIKKLVSKKSLALIGLFQILSASLTVFAINFLDSSRVYIPICLIALAVVSEIIIKKLQYRLMKKLDNDYVDNAKIVEKRFRTYLTRYEDFKKVTISVPTRLITSTILTVALSFALIINDVKNIIIFVFSLFYALFYAMFFYPKNKETEKRIAVQEERMDFIKSVNTFKTEVKSLHNLAYKQSLIVNCQKLVCFSMFLMISILMMYLSNIVSLPYIAFCLASGMMLSSSMIDIFLWSQRSDETNLAIVRLNNLIDIREKNKE